MDTGKIIKGTLIMYGISQTALAQYLKMLDTTLSEKLKDSSRFTPNELKEIKTFINIKIEKLNETIPIDEKIPMIDMNYIYGIKKENVE